MKKIYPVIVVFVFLLLQHISLAQQCTVKIVANPSSGQLNCKDDSTVILTATPAMTKGLVIYSWSKMNSSTIIKNKSDTIHVHDVGIYTVQITDSAGCMASNNSINITTNTTAPTISIQAFPSTICSGGSAAIVATSTGNSSVTYLWIPDSSTTSTIVIAPAKDTLYKVTATGRNGCSSTDSVTLHVNPLPDADISADTAKGCQNGNEPIITFKGSNGKSPYTFIYTSNKINNGSDQTISTSGTNTSAIVFVPNENTGQFIYQLHSVSDDNGCMNTVNDMVTVTISAVPTLTSPKTASVCNKSLFMYTALSQTGTNFSWKRLQVSGITATGLDSDSTANITNTLTNNDTIPHTEIYVFTLSKGPNTCERKDSLLVTVYPTPVIDPISSPMVFCNGQFVSNGIPFSSSSPDISFAWTSTQTVGFGTKDTGSIPAFVAKYTGADSLIATVTVSDTITNTRCYGAPLTFTVIVKPTPHLTGSKDTSICNNIYFTDTAASSATGTQTTFSWKRASVSGISNPADSSSSAVINETLINDTTQPIVVKYIFTLSTGNGCSGTDSLQVTVYPSPEIDSTSDTSFCNGYLTSGIPFRSTSPDSSFTWTSTSNIGFNTSGVGNIGAFTALNISGQPLLDTVIAYATVNGGKCSGVKADIFKITVNPSPARPAFTSLPNLPDNTVLSVCHESENINFNVISPVARPDSISYKWTSALRDTSKAFIKDSSHPNTVITFKNTGTSTLTDTITVTVTDSTIKCTNSAFQVVNITNNTSGISPGKEKKIFKKEPGNLLIYPDNSLEKYQWGYDTVISFVPNTFTSKPNYVQGQVYQFYIPDSASCHCIKSNDSLDTDHFYYWVQLHNNGCDTKIYFNGPYDDKPNSIKIINPDNSVRLQIIPNPNKGVFKMSLQGNIYGTIEAQVYSSAGQLVYRKQFVKTSADITETFITNGLSTGVYFLVLRSSDLKEIYSRFIISR